MKTMYTWKHSHARLFLNAEAFRKITDYLERFEEGRLDPEEALYTALFFGMSRRSNLPFGRLLRDIYVGGVRYKTDEMRKRCTIYYNLKPYERADVAMAFVNENLHKLTIRLDSMQQIPEVLQWLGMPDWVAHTYANDVVFTRNRYIYLDIVETLQEWCMNGRFKVFYEAYYQHCKTAGKEVEHSRFPSTTLMDSIDISLGLINHTIWDLLMG